MKVSQADLGTLRSIHKAGSLQTKEQRLDALNRLSFQIKSHETEILNALKMDLGKPTLEAYLSEIYFVLREIKDTIKNLNSWMKPKKVPGVFFARPAKSYISYESLGTVLIIAPGNYPFKLAFTPLVSAIAVGTFGTLKP